MAAANPKPPLSARAYGRPATTWSTHSRVSSSSTSHLRTKTKLRRVIQAPEEEGFRGVSGLRAGVFQVWGGGLRGNHQREGLDIEARHEVLVS